MDTVGNADEAPPVIWPKPPVIAAACLACGLLAERYWPLNPEAFSPKLETVLAGGTMMVCAIAIAVLALTEMTKANTAIIPGQPAQALVSSGVFGRTRNPIYLSFVVLLAGLGVALTSPWLIIAGVLLWLYLQERVIKREEAYLLARFGEDYALYRKRVRRWF